jgi:hypothetical protein
MSKIRPAASTELALPHRGIVLPRDDRSTVPALIAETGPEALRRYVEFFTANIRNPNTRAAYHRNACRFFDWCHRRRSGCCSTGS